MENLFNPRYMKNYMQGYTFGLNPIFHDFEDLQNLSAKFNKKAFKEGFRYGRTEYERLNGRVSKGIPERILTGNHLQEFMLEGTLGMAPELDGYTNRQLKHIRKWYEKGCANYEADNDISLYLVLIDAGINL